MSEWVDYSWWFIPLWLEHISIFEVIAPFALIWVLIGLTFAKVVGKAPDLSHSSEGLALLALAAILMEMGGIVIANMIRPGGGYSRWDWFGPMVPLPINLIVSLIGLIILRSRREDSVTP